MLKITIMYFCEPPNFEFKIFAVPQPTCKRFAN